MVRDEAKGARVAAELTERTGQRDIQVHRADMGELGDVRRVCEELLAQGRPLHGLVHNAGALDDVYQRSSEGIEKTAATHVVGPWLMTELLRPALERAGHSRVLWVSSGGMYAEPLRVDALEMSPEGYDGVIAYARAKRAQVTLSELLAEELKGAGVLVHAMHPGWVDTPGVERSLPRFRALLRPLLRSPAEGTDTIIYLPTAPEGEVGTGGFWLDRARRPLHRLGKTRRSDTPEERARLLAWVRGRAGVHQR